MSTRTRKTFFKFISLFTLVFFIFNTVPVEAIIYSKDQISTKEWYHDYIDTQEAWDLLDKYVPNNERIKVASIDTGAYLWNNDLNENIDKENCVRISGDSVITGVRTPKFSHGTSLASIIAATSNNNSGIAGVAAGNRNNIVSLMCINIACEEFPEYCENYKRATTTDNIINGIYYAVEHGAKIICMCLGHDSSYIDANDERFDDKRIQRAITNIAKSNPDVLFIASAGNNSSTEKWYMSDFSNVLSVINTKEYTNIYSKWAKALNSNYGWNKTFSAPGKGVSTVSFYNNVKSSGGTSASVAVATGVAALTLYANPKLTRKKLKKVLCTTTTDLYKKGFDKYTGHGNINAYNAVSKALRMQGYKGIPKTLKSVRGPNKPAEITYEKEFNKKKKIIRLHWSECTSNAGYINQYRIFASNKLNGKYIRIATVDGHRYSYNIKKNKYRYKNIYFKIKPYGTTLDGKKMYPKNNGSKDAIKVKIKTKSKKTKKQNIKKTKK